MGKSELPARKAIPLSEAQRLIAGQVRPGLTERVPLGQSFGRRLAEPLVADAPMPAFARSGMDGFAVRLADLAEASSDRPVRLAVTETIGCGFLPQRAVGAGEAARIMTGAAVPSGAEAVVPLEAARTDADGRWALFARPVAAGANVTPVGAEIAAGTPLLAAGDRIGPGEAALLAAYGFAAPLVYARPRVAVLTTGSELLEPDEPPTPGRIRNSNRDMLRGLVASAGGLVAFERHVADDAASVLAALRDAADAADVLLTTGGVSVGDFDVMAGVMTDKERKLLFNKIAMRPASVTSAAVQAGRLLFGLSGNPGACFVGFELLVRPALAVMGGAAAYELQSVPARLDGAFSKGSAFPRYVRGTYGLQGDAVLRARPCELDSSSAMVSLKEADCLICMPATRDGLADAHPVETIPLSWRGSSFWSRG